MSSRKRREQAQPAPESRKQLHMSRRAREQRKLLLSISVPLLVLAIIVIGIGIFREMYQIPNTPVAQVNGERISASTYTPRVQYERRLLLNYINQISQLALSSDPSFINQLATGQRQQLPQNTLDKLIDEALIRQEAKQRGIAVTSADVDQQIYDEMATAIAPPPTSVPELTATVPVSGTAAVSGTLAAPTVSATGTVSATAAVSATAVVTPISTREVGRQFEQRVQPMLDQIGITRDQYREIVREGVFRDRLNKAQGDEIADKEKQVEAEFLVFKDQATADQAAADLTKGAAWEAVVAQFGPRPTPAAAPEAGAEATPAVAAPVEATLALGATPPTPTPEPYATERGAAKWYTQYGLVSELAVKEEDAQTILGLKPATAAKPIQGGRGYFVLWLRQAEDSRAVDATELKTRRDNALQDWLKKRKDELTAADKIQKYPLEAYIPAEAEWFTRGWDQLLNTAQPTLGSDALKVFTAVPGGGTPPPAEAGATPPAPPAGNPTGSP